MWAASLAKRLGAQLFCTAFDRAGRHAESAQYAAAAEVLGVYVTQRPPDALPGDPLELTYPQAVAIANGSAPRPPCHAAVRVRIGTCAGLMPLDPKDVWCPNRADYDDIDTSQWLLRGAGARGACHRARLGVARHHHSSLIHAVWHVRTGDMCLYCGNATYFTDVWARITGALGAAAPLLRLRFETEKPQALDFLRPHFPEASINASSIVDAVCDFLTADILLTSGSSFPAMVAAFAPPWTPVVFEERRKEIYLFSDPEVRAAVRQHFLSAKDAVLMHAGQMALSHDELRGVLRALY